MPSLEFKGKSFVYTHHLSVPFRELVVDAKKSLPPKGQKPSLDDNLIIHGDNLHALKALMPVYAGKVDCIFIDPPYNTGEEGWCYNDNVRSPLMKEWLKKEANPVDKEDLERHDKWLCMMWPRLSLLFELLADDGVFLVSIDDNEQHRLRLLLDEVFGEDRFVASIAWQKRTSPDQRKRLGPAHDTIHVYSKLPNRATLSKLSLPDDFSDGFSNPDRDPKGAWASTDMTAQNPDPTKRKDQQYKIKLPNGKMISPPPGRCWGMLEPEFLRLKDEGEIWFGAKGTARPRIKTYLGRADGLSSWTWWPHQDAGTNEKAKKEVLELLGSGNTFDYPKPTQLLSRILQLTTSSESLILDSFAGSGTTAHAVLAANAKDGGNRKFILIESEDYADTLTAERVRRVINGYAFEGTKREELFRETISWTTLKKAADLVEKVDGIKMMEEKRFDRITPAVKDGELIVTGEKKVTKKTEGLGGSFTFATLGAEMSIEALLADGLPEFDALAQYVFYTATGVTLGDVAKQTPKAVGYIGETDSFRVHLLYKPNSEWLRSNDAALTEELVDRIVATNKGAKKVLVFGAAKFMGQRELTRKGVDFCQLPYAIHRILGG